MVIEERRAAFEDFHSIGQLMTHMVHHSKKAVELLKSV
jgi:hypothetical protein